MLSAGQICARLFSIPHRVRPRGCSVIVTKFCEFSSIPSSTTISPLLDKSVIFSGIQPTGIPHLGNYLGALREWVQIQNDAPPTSRLYFSIVDLHAVTTRLDPENLREWKYQTLAVLLAIGLDPSRSTIFFQSDVKSLMS